MNGKKIYQWGHPWMIKILTQKRYLITCKGDESIEKKIEKAAKGAKLRVKTNKGSEFGSGMHSSKNGSNMLKKNKRLPEIKRLERDVLQCIIGQDKQVRK